MVGGLVADGSHHVGVVDVVDERYVLVADALDVVLTEAVVEHRRALEGLDRHDAGAVVVLQAVTGAQGAGRPRGRDEGAQAKPGSLPRRCSKTSPSAAPVHW